MKIKLTIALILAMVVAGANAQDGTVTLNPTGVTPNTYGPCISAQVSAQGRITNIVTVPCPGGGGGGIGGSGTAGAVPIFTDATALGDSHLSQSGNSFTVQNNNAPQSFLLANHYTDPANRDGLFLTSNAFGIGWVGVFSEALGSGTPRQLAIGTLNGAEVLLYANGAISTKWHMNGSVDFNGSVFVPDLFVGILGTGAQHRVHFYNNQTPFDTTLTGGAATENVDYKLPTKDGEPGQVLSTNGAGQLEWVTR